MKFPIIVAASVVIPNMRLMMSPVWRSVWQSDREARIEDVRTHSDHKGTAVALLDFCNRVCNHVVGSIEVPKVNNAMVLYILH